MEPSLADFIMDEFMQVPRFVWPSLISLVVAVAGRIAYRMFKKYYRSGKK